MKETEKEVERNLSKIMKRKFDTGVNEIMKKIKLNEQETKFTLNLNPDDKHPDVDTDILEEVQKKLSNLEDSPISILLFFDFVCNKTKSLQLYMPLLNIVLLKLNNLRDYYVKCNCDFEDTITNYQDIPFIYDTWINKLMDVTSAEKLHLLKP